MCCSGKKTTVFFIVTLVILFIIPCISSYAQSSELLKFEHLIANDGISHSKTYNIIQDRQGFLWIATQYGLNKYDGHDIKVYTNVRNDPHSLSSNFIWHLFEDDSGMIWASTWGNGVNSYDPVKDTFTRFMHDADDPDSLSSGNVWSSYQDRQGTLWVCTDNGLNKLNSDNKTFTRYHHNPADPTSISNNSVSSMHEDRNGNLWVTTYGGGLNKFDRTSGEFISYQNDPATPGSLSNNNIWQSHLDRNGILWLATEGGLNKFNPDTEVFTRYQHTPDDPSSISNNTLTYIIEDESGKLWISTFGGGLNHFDPQTGIATRFQEDTDNIFSIRNNTVWGSVIDNTGALWVTSEDGINVYDPGRHQFEMYNYQANNPKTHAYKGCYSFHIDKENQLWAGSDSFGLAKFNQDRTAYISYRHDEEDANSLLNNQVFSLQADITGILWVGTLEGLSRFDPATETFSHFQHEPDNANSLSGNQVFDIAIEENGNIWLAIYGKGLTRYNPVTQKFTNYTPAADQTNRVITAWISTVEITSDGHIWAGGEGGLSRLDPESGKFTNYVRGPGQLSSSSVMVTHEDRTGKLWVGTDNGLQLFDPESDSFSTYFTEDGLPSNHIIGIVDDDRGNIWISTNRGLSKFNPNTKTFKNYDAADGLQGNEFMARAVYKSPNGDLIFGGREGFNIVNPDQLHSNPHIPSVVLTDFLLFNTSVTVGDNSPLTKQISRTDKITLSHTQSVFSFKFAALNFRHPEKNRFAYKLEGFDDNWRLTNSDMRFATYTNLDAGRYIFRVKACNNDSVWNEVGTSIVVTILAPWWETSWFYTLCALGVLGIFGLVYQDQAGKLRKERAFALALQEREEKYRTLFESFPLGINISDSTGKIIESNPIADTLLGISGTEQKEDGINWQDWKVLRSDGTRMPPEEFPGVNSLKEKRKIENVELGILKSDDQITWLIATVAPIPLENYGVAITYSDITYRKQIEEEIGKQQRLFETMFNTIPDGVIITNTKHEMQLANKSMHAIFGYRPENLIGKTAQLLHADQNTYNEPGLSLLNQDANGQQELYTTLYKKKDGDDFPGETFRAKLFDEEYRWIGNVSIIRDITEREQAELLIQQSQKMDAIGTLAGGIAHDFNNILSPIIGYSQMLMEDLEDDSSQHRDIVKIYYAAIRARDLVKQILAFSRQVDQEIVPLKLQSIVKEAMKLLRSTIPTIIDFKQDIDPECNLILANPTQIHQIIMNLCTNAYHAMENSGGTLKVTLKQVRHEADSLFFPKLAPGKYALLNIADTGVGIEKDILDKIFNPYFTTKEEGKGTGLGLSIVHGIVKKHNGDIHIYSEPGKGTEIHIYLPILDKDNSTVIATDDKPIIGGNERILLVDDEEAIIAMGKQMLERLGYTVVTQNGSVEGLAAFKANPDDFDLIITDMNMPKMTGADLAQKIRNDGFDIPMILSTGFSDQVTEEKCKALNIQGYIIKPINKRDLAEAIRIALTHR